MLYKRFQKDSQTKKPDFEPDFFAFLNSLFKLDYMNQ
jgi:hypothetical protein